MESLGEILKKLSLERDIAREGKNTASVARDCPFCGGVGFVYASVPFGHPYFGRALPCRCLEREYQTGAQARLERYSNLGPLTRLTFDNLQPQGKEGLAGFPQAYEAALAFAQEPRGWLVLLGPSGCGKTHLAAAIANYCLKQGQPVLFLATADLLDHLRATYSPSSELSYDELFNRVKEVPLLILDDLGGHTTTPWAQEKLFQLINHRYQARLPTVVTSRSPLSSLDEALSSRLMDSSLSRIVAMEAIQVWEGVEVEELRQLQRMTFDRWEKRPNLPAEIRHNLEGAYQRTWEFAQEPKDWLVFLGKTGCGKTHLAAAIANYRLKQGKPVLFTAVPGFLDHLRSTFSPDSRTGYDQLFERVRKATLLILDDFGEQASTPWAWEKLYQIIGYRHNARLPMVITSRLSLEELEEKHSPIMSRIADSRLSLAYTITAPDYRIDHLPPKHKSRYR